MSDKKKSARSTSTRLSKLLSDEERAAMKETLKERRRALSGEATGKATFSRRSPRCRKGIAALPSGSMLSSKTLSPRHSARRERCA